MDCSGRRTATTTPIADRLLCYTPLFPGTIREQPKLTNLLHLRRIKTGRTDLLALSASYLDRLISVDTNFKRASIVGRN